MNLRPFELALVIIFAVLAMLALVLLSSFSPEDDSEKIGISDISAPVRIWGTLPSAGMNTVLEALALENESFKQVTYEYVPLENFDDTFLNSLADDMPPDIILFPHEKLVEYRSRLQPFSFESFPLRDIRSLYLDGAQIFAMKDGLYAYPYMVDPLMMYWNKSLFASNNLLTPPETWEEVLATVLPTLIERGFDRTIKRPVIAMGEFNNIRHPIATLSALLLQGGTVGIVESEAGTYDVRLNETQTGTTKPFLAAVDFYTRFSNPTNNYYSWNRSLTQDRTLFSQEEQLALYFGFGSEGREIEALNPNVSFDIAELPQGSGATVRRTYGRHYGLGLVRAGENQRNAQLVLGALTDSAVVQLAADSYAMVPSLRSLAARGSDDVYGRLTYRSAAVAYGLLYPDSEATADIFATMVSDLSASRESVSSAVGDAEERLRQVF